MRGGREQLAREQGSGLRPRLKSPCELTGVEPVRMAPAKLLVRSIHMEKYPCGCGHHFLVYSAIPTCSPSGSHNFAAIAPGPPKPGCDPLSGSWGSQWSAAKKNIIWNLKIHMDVPSLLPFSPPSAPSRPVWRPHGATAGRSGRQHHATIPVVFGRLLAGVALAGRCLGPFISCFC